MTFTVASPNVATSNQVTVSTVGLESDNSAWSQDVDGRVIGAADGYQGQDEFAVLEGVLGRRFPIHGEDGGPTGKTRQLHYKLAAGEAGWLLQVDRTTEF